MRAVIVGLRAVTSRPYSLTGRNTLNRSPAEPPVRKPNEGLVSEKAEEPRQYRLDKLRGFRDCRKSEMSLSPVRNWHRSKSLHKRELR